MVIIIISIFCFVVDTVYNFTIKAKSEEPVVVTYALDDSPIPEFNTETTYEKIIEEKESLQTDETENIEETKQVFSIPSNSGFKSYMYYTSITARSSLQYKLQTMACTGSFGIRMVDDRYCVAVGSAFGMRVGQYFDLVLQNGVVIPCVLADVKANNDTDSSNIFTGNGCCSEFIVDKAALDQNARRMGDISYCYEKWQSPVVWIHVYQKYVW